MEEVINLLHPVRKNNNDVACIYFLEFVSIYLQNSLAIIRSKNVVLYVCLQFCVRMFSYMCLFFFRFFCIFCLYRC